MTPFEEIIQNYKNDQENNDHIWESFKDKVEEYDFLKNHRNYIEKNELGFGDRSFHYMWYLLLSHLKASGKTLSFMEIGVFKGQVISLWSLIAKELELTTSITAVSPFEGNVGTKSRWIKAILRRVSSKFREEERVGNLYNKANFIEIITNLFAHFGLDFSTVEKHKGFSSDTAIYDQVSKKEYDLIYIDGDHSYEGAKRDMEMYSKLIVPGGYLVMDDASHFLEGSKFWKGHIEVSKACEVMKELPFKNILNVGHNRIYQKNH